MNKRVCVSVLVASCLVLGIAGCSDPRKPSKGNFARAIEQYLAGADPQRRMFCMRLPQSPIHDGDSLKFVFSFDPTKGDSPSPQMDALVAVGLVERKDEDIDEQFYRNGWKRAVFTVDPKHREVFRPFGFICGGRVELVSVDRWTEPADLFGVRVSEVQATMGYVDLPPWMRSDAMRSDAAWGDSLERAENSFRRTYIMQLTNEGWEARELSPGFPFF